MTAEITFDYKRQGGGRKYGVWGYTGDTREKGKVALAVERNGAGYWRESEKKEG
jgi:hypothetical protein